MYQKMFLCPQIITQTPFKTLRGLLLRLKWSNTEAKMFLYQVCIGLIEIEQCVFVKNVCIQVPSKSRPFLATENNELLLQNEFGNLHPKWVKFAERMWRLFLFCKLIP